MNKKYVTEVNYNRTIFGRNHRITEFKHRINTYVVDLKPENILLSFDPRAGKCIDLKLCDFGLSTKFKPKQVLSDFCGSPGMLEAVYNDHRYFFINK